MSDFPRGVTLTVLPAPPAGLPAPHLVNAPITAQYEVAPEHFLMRLRDPRTAGGAPGQFVMLKPTRADDLHPILPRPMAVYRYLPVSDEFEIVYRVIGTGTRLMSERHAGEEAELVGPVGQCFQIASPAQQGSGTNGSDRPNHAPLEGLLAIGRGIGTCSLTSAAETAAARGARVYAVVSARRPDALIGLDLFARLGAQALQVTDAEGTSDPERVAEFVAPLLRLGRVQQVLVCGSNRLIELATRLAAPYGVDVQVSLEAHMACGIGYCHGCSHGAVGESEEAPLVCREGPVFRARHQPETARSRPAAAATERL